MEKFRSIFIIVVVIVAYFLLLRSCLSSDVPAVASDETETKIAAEKEVDTEPEVSFVEPSESSSNEDREPEPIKANPSVPGQLMVGVVHTVKGPDVWINSYFRSSNEENRVGVYQNIDVPDHIFVLEQITQQRVNEKIAAGSVNYFFNVLYKEETNELEQFCVAVYYEMEDFKKWKSIFESQKLVNIRNEVGLKVWAYARGYSNRNQIYILFTTSDLEPIYDLIDVNAFKRAYEEAGVLKDPDIHFLELIENPNTD